VLPAGAPAAPGDGSVTGVVREVIYAGSESRVVVAAAGATLTALQLNAGGAGALARGDTVVLSWHPEAVRVLDD
jgi:hypothetical protein